jgi:hypothetical protein
VTAAPFPPPDPTDGLDPGERALGGTASSLEPLPVLDGGVLARRRRRLPAAWRRWRSSGWRWSSPGS